MDYIFDRDSVDLADETYEFIKDRISACGYVTLDQVNIFIGSPRLYDAYENACDVGWTSMDGVDLGWRNHDIVYVDKHGNEIRSGSYFRAMTLTMPEPKEII